MRIIDNEIRKRIEYLLEKKSDEITEEELNTVKDLNLTNIDYSNEILNTDLGELEKIKNLENLKLNEFEINNEIIKSLYKCKKLKNLYLNLCTVSGENIKMNNLNKIFFDHCIIENWNKIELPNEIYILTGADINLDKFINAENIKTLSIRGANILNIKKILEFKNLEILNLDGSTIDDENILDMIKNKVKISKEDSCLPIE